MNGTGITPRSYNGYCHTPKGTLKVLVIYAGFTNDNQLNANGTPVPTPYNNTSPNNPWPQLGGNGSNSEWGYSLPPSAATTFYTSASQFSATAADFSLSNFYYQMSQHNTQPLKMLAVNFPVRVNVTATTAIDTTGGWFTYSEMVLDRIRTEYQKQLQDALNQGLDARTNTPAYNSDNSISAPDDKVDYTVIIWRYAGGSPPGTIRLQNAIGSGGGYASVPSVTLTPTGVIPAITTADGFTQCTGMGGLDKAIFTHEFAHTLYDAPHTAYRNGVVGKHFDTTDGYGMIGGPMLDCANGWERWYMNWITLQASGTSANVTGPAALSAGGLYTLRDFITTGDVVRIQLPNSRATDGTYQYLWLENHQGKSVWDRRQWDLDGQNPAVAFPAPARGLIAYVEDMHTTQVTPRGPTGNGWLVDLGAGGLRILPATGNFDAQPSGTSSAFNRHLWDNIIYNFVGTNPNPTGSANNLTWRRADRNGDQIINYNGFTNANFTTIPQPEGYPYWSSNGVFGDGLMGVGMTYKTVGQKLGMNDNPALYPSQEFTPPQTMSPINLSGLTVELTGVATNGDITVRVRFNDVNLSKNVKWTGNVALNTTPGATYAANVQGFVNLTVDISGTPNRTTAIAGAVYPFSTPSRLTVRDGATLHIDDNGKLTLRNGSTVYVENSANLLADPDGRIQVERGSRLSVKTQAMADALRAYGQLALMSGGQLEIRDTNTVITGARVANPLALEVYPNPAAILMFRLAEATNDATYQYRVLNAYGQAVRTATVTGEKLVTGVQLTGLPAGPYLLDVQASDGTRSVQRAEVR